MLDSNSNTVKLERGSKLLLGHFSTFERLLSRDRSDTGPVMTDTMILYISIRPPVEALTPTESRKGARV